MHDLHKGLCKGRGDPAAELKTHLPRQMHHAVVLEAEGRTVPTAGGSRSLIVCLLILSMNTDKKKDKHDSSVNEVAQVSRNLKKRRSKCFSILFYQKL